MKNLFTRLSILLMAATLFGLTSCKDDDEKFGSVVGIWKLTNEESSFMGDADDDAEWYEDYEDYIVLTESGEYSTYSYYRGKLDEEEHSTYTYDGKTIVIHDSELDMDFTAKAKSLSSNKMVLFMDLLLFQGTAEYEKVSSLPSK